MKTAILVDAEFFLTRHRILRGHLPTVEVVASLISMCSDHMALVGRSSHEQLYRILVYDCLPLSKKLHYPVSKKIYDLSKTPTYAFRVAFHSGLRTQRKVAIRLGTLHEKMGRWAIRPDAQKDLMARKLTVDQLADEHFYYDVEQKSVDMRIGLDIASIASKRFADQIILIAGDSDFLPAAKVARREGVDFILDPMGAHVAQDLRDHIDGLHSPLQPLPKPHG